MNLLIKFKFYTYFNKMLSFGCLCNKLLVYISDLYVTYHSIKSYLSFLLYVKHSYTQTQKQKSYILVVG